MLPNEYIEKLKDLPEPWCNFRIDEKFSESILEQLDYDTHGVIREIIYDHYPNDASITLGSLPPIISPMFWETVSGIKRENIVSLKYPGKCISEERYAGYLRMYEYQRKILKIYLINPRAYQDSLKKSYNEGDLTSDEKIADLNRRINGLNLLKKAIENDEWSKLFLIVPKLALVKDKDESFTITSHFHVRLHRVDGGTGHKGVLIYSPDKSEILDFEWSKRWKQAHDYGKHRNDWPDSLLRPEDILIYKEKCKKFNNNSIKILQNQLSLLKSSFSEKPYKLESSKWDVFLCHASEDKLAIVEDFHEACRAAGINTWIDKEQIRWGSNIIDQISNGIANSRFVVIFVTKTALSSYWVLEELNTAFAIAKDKDRYVLPVILGMSHDQLEKTYPILAGKHYKSIPFYDSSIPANKDEIANLVLELKKELDNIKRK